jgi:hypothetical protein
VRFLLIQTFLLIFVVAAQYSTKARTTTPVEELEAILRDRQKFLKRITCDRAIIYSSSAFDQLHTDADILKAGFSGSAKGYERLLEETDEAEYAISFDIRDLAVESLLKSLGLPTDTTALQKYKHGLLGMFKDQLYITGELAK